MKKKNSYRPFGLFFLACVCVTKKNTKLTHAQKVSANYEGKHKISKWTEMIRKKRKDFFFFVNGFFVKRAFSYLVYLFFFCFFDGNDKSRIAGEKIWKKEWPTKKNQFSRKLEMGFVQKLHIQKYEVQLERFEKKNCKT